MGSADTARVGSLLRSISAIRAARRSTHLQPLSGALGATQIQAAPDAYDAGLGVAATNPNAATQSLSPLGVSGERLNDGSRMSREVHVRFWESVEVRFLCATLLLARIRNPARSRGGVASLLRVLQRPPTASVPGRAHPRCGLRRAADAADGAGGMNTMDTPKRPEVAVSSTSGQNRPRRIAQERRTRATPGLGGYPPENRGIHHNPGQISITYRSRKTV